MIEEIWDAHVTVGKTAFSEIEVDAMLDLMDRHGIARAVLAPIDRWMAVDNREGNMQIVSWVRRWPQRFLGYVTANPWFGERAVDEIRRGLDEGLCAIKLHPARQGFRLLEPEVEPILELAERRSVAVYMVTGVATSSLPLQLAEIARRHPALPFIMGRSGRTDYGWLDLAKAVQQAPNIYVETAHNLPGSLASLAGRIGWQRIIFASDAPLTNVQLEIAKLAELKLSSDRRRDLFKDNLVRLLGGGVDARCI